ncbi:MAG TPA: hypothetical protein VMD53_08820 [Rhizomicrobium sp.]|nr:hypothetical protein [Rhizomicrobium sp.]
MKSSSRQTPVIIRTLPFRPPEHGAPETALSLRPAALQQQPRCNTDVAAHSPFKISVSVLTPSIEKSFGAAQIEFNFMSAKGGWGGQVMSLGQSSANFVARSAGFMRRTVDLRW